MKNRWMVDRPTIDVPIWNRHCRQTLEFMQSQLSAVSTVD
jgi:hypothetical protein